MAGQSLDDRLDSVAPGDIIELPTSRGPGVAGQQYKVVHKDVVLKDDDEADAASMIVVTLEGESGETFDVELPADAVVNRSLESKWESAQSPTLHQGS